MTATSPSATDMRDAAQHFQRVHAACKVFGFDHRRGLLVVRLK